MVNEACDVTLRQNNDASAADETATYNRIFSGALRSKTNAERSGSVEYTSTPKRSNCVLDTKEKGQVGVLATFDPRVKEVALLFGFLIIGYKSIILAMPLISTDSVQEWNQQVLSHWNATLEWSTQHQLGSKLSPFLCGFLVAIFAYGIVYLDSVVPGVNPPSPFTPRSKKRHHDEKNSSLHLSYLCALLCGALVTVFMYFDLYSS
ncbi:uncharacterized protein [Drosophila bipectinata]|uniref:uncharacterized protein n=1 Tax=Drosophila bipectinata TaxID=42026 RepID=UPI001C8A0F10|nr:uncharacterized protein LOC108123140 [Drosophila bipectinata]